MYYNAKTDNQIVYFKVNKENNIEVSCSCEQTNKNKVCSHVLGSVSYLLDTGSFSQFVPYTNQKIEKNKLLEEFGLTLDDPESKEFIFTTDYAGRLNISFVPPHFVGFGKISGVGKVLKPEKTLKKTTKYKEETHRIGIYFQLSNKNISNAPCKIEAYKIEAGKKGDDKLTRVLIGKEENIPVLSVVDEQNFNVLMDFSYLNFKEYLGSGYYTQSYNIFTSQPYDSTRKQYLKYFFGKLDEHWHTLAEWENIKLLGDGDNFSKNNLSDLKLSIEPVYPDIKVEITEKFIALKVSFTDADGQVIIGENESKDIYYGKIIMHDHTLYLNKRNELSNFLCTMTKGVLYFPVKFSEKVMKEILMPLQMHYGVMIPETLATKIKEIPMVPAVHLKEFQDRVIYTII